MVCSQKICHNEHTFYSCERPISVHDFIQFGKIHATDIFWVFNLHLQNINPCEYCTYVYKCMQMCGFTALSPGRNYPLVAHIRPPLHRTPGPSTRACRRLCSSSGRSTEPSSGKPPSEALPLWCPTGHCTSSPTPWNWYIHLVLKLTRSVSETFCPGGNKVYKAILSIKIKVT